MQPTRILNKLVNMIADKKIGTILFIYLFI